jgi:hypothetical protein
MRTKLTVAATALFGLVLAGAPAFAQDAKVTIPFAFKVMGQTLPAGDYQFTVQSPEVITLESVNFPDVQVALPVIERLSDAAKPGETKAVFSRAGRTDVLTQLWLDGEDGFVVSLPKR